MSIIPKMIKTSNQSLKKILEAYKEISLLTQVSSVLSWDQNTYMPPMGADNRAAQLTILQEIITNKWNDAELKSLIEQIDDRKLNAVEEAAMRNIRRTTKFYFNVPKNVILKNTEVTSKAFSIWQEARAKNDFKAFAPILTEIFALKKEIAGFLGYKKNPYDALLDLYEPGLDSKECEQVFTQLQPKITTLLKRIVSSKEYKKPNPFMAKTWHYPEAEQKKLSDFIMKKMTYSMDEGRLDISAHPFTTELGRNDIRITTRYHEDDVRSAYAATIHEAGHGLYELGIDEEYSHSPFAGGVSLGIHESQSRFWENQVGRSREFLHYMSPVFSTLFADVFGNATEHDLVKYVNHVKPGLIRIESDEVTYNLHIILRFEIENAMMNNKFSVKEIPDVWNQKMKKYLGIVPDVDSQGCMQDVHWSYGDVGYFPTYCLGTMFAAQYGERMRKSLKVDALVSRGELAPIREWLRKQIHVHGSRFTPQEVIMKVTGEPLNPKYFVDYLERKYSAIYDLT